MRITVILTSFAICALTSCVSENVQNAVAKAAETWHAESYSTGYENRLDTDHGEKYTLIATLKNIDSVDHIKPERITSTSALIIFQNLNTLERKNYNEIKLVIENASGTTVESYAMNRLAFTDSMAKMIRSFIDSWNDRDTVSLLGRIDNEHIPDSGFSNILNGMGQLDSAYGQIYHITVIGFRYDHVKQTNEPINVLWFETSSASEAVTDFTFYVSEENGKIIYIGVNDGGARL